MGHWYTADREPMHRVKGKNGKMRGTRIADARRLGLFPSVTTILGVLDKPGLNNWRVKNAVLEAERARRMDDETDGQFVYRCEKIARERASEAARKGIVIHDVLESWLAGNTLDNDYFEIIRAVHYTLRDLIPGFDEMDRVPERIVADPVLGYGGKYDLKVPAARAMIDFKTKDFDTDGMEKVRGYDDQGMQLAAYARAEGMYPWQSSATRDLSPPRLINIFVSRNNPGLVKPYEHEGSERLEQAWTACCDLYHAMNPGLRDG